MFRSSKVFFVPRIVTLTSSLALYVYANDHAPPHFHIVTPDRDAMVDFRTLQVIRGEVKRQDLAAAIAWAADPVNMAALEAEWRRLNEQD